jgi:hypothetical protein
MSHWRTHAVLILFVSAVALFALGAVTRPQGEAPEQAIRIDSIDDLSRLSPEELERLGEENADVDLEKLGADVRHRFDEVSKTVRSMKQNYRIPAVRNASGTASTGGSQSKGR